MVNHIRPNLQPPATAQQSTCMIMPISSHQAPALMIGSAGDGIAAGSTHNPPAVHAGPRTRCSCRRGPSTPTITCLSYRFRGSVMFAAPTALAPSPPITCAGRNGRAGSEAGTAPAGPAAAVMAAAAAAVEAQATAAAAIAAAQSASAMANFHHGSQPVRQGGRHEPLLPSSRITYRGRHGQRHLRLSSLAAPVQQCSYSTRQAPLKIIEIMLDCRTSAVKMAVSTFRCAEHSIW